MGVLSVKTDWSSEAAGGSGERRTATRAWTVEVASPADGAVVVQTAPGIPRKGEEHPDDPWLRAEIPQVARLAPMLYRVTVEYTSASGSGSAGDNPLQQPARKRWGYASSYEPVDVDAKNKPILNTAGCTFDPPVQAEVFDDVLTVTRNEATFDRTRSRAYNGAVNKDTFYGAPPGEALVTVEAEEVHEGKFAYWQVTYQVRFRRGGWRKRRANVGLTQLRDGQRVPIFDSQTGQPVTEPQPLNSDGSHRSGNAAPDILEFEVQRGASFGPLRL